MFMHHTILREVILVNVVALVRANKGTLNVTTYVCTYVRTYTYIGSVLGHEATGPTASTVWQLVLYLYLLSY